MLLGTVSIIPATTTIYAIYLISWIIYCLFFHPLRWVPGPFLASISRVWIVFKTAAGDMEKTQRALHKVHGYLVRIAPNEVYWSDPEAIKIIYNTKNIFPKTDYYDAWTPPNNGYAGHFATRDEKMHAERRRIVNSVYSMSSVLESEESIDSCSLLFCKTMSKFAKHGQVIDLGRRINMYAFDVGELFYGRKFGFMAEDTDIGGYMNAIGFLLPAFTLGGTLPSYLTKFYLVASILFSPSIRGALGAIKHLAKASESAVKKRQQELSDKQDDGHDMLRKMLKITTDQRNKVDFDFEHVCVESHSSLFAGADTTAIEINSILYYLMGNSAAYQKLTAEIDVAVSDGRLSLPCAYADAVKLPYLKACINEGMRLHPSVGLTLPRLVPAGGATIAGVYFPAGYRVGINGAVVQYDKEVFGGDADQFNPDRWIQGDVVRMEKAMIQFGAGPRTCIGKNISLSEIYKLVPQIIRLFEIRLVDPTRPWHTSNFWFNRQSNILVHVRERDIG